MWLLSLTHRLAVGRQQGTSGAQVATCRADWDHADGPGSDLDAPCGAPASHEGGRMERLGGVRSWLVSVVMGLALAALPVLAFAQTDDGSGAAALFGSAFSCICGLIVLAIYVAIAYWIYTDAKKRGNPNAVIWAIVGFVLGLIGLLLYVLIGRNQGTSAPPPAGPTGPSTTARY
jgi:hypothetical protein